MSFEYLNVHEHEWIISIRHQQMWEVFRTHTNNGGPSHADRVSSVSDE